MTFVAPIADSFKKTVKNTTSSMALQCYTRTPRHHMIEKQIRNFIYFVITREDIRTRDYCYRSLDTGSDYHLVVPSG